MKAHGGAKRQRTADSQTYKLSRGMVRQKHHTHEWMNGRKEKGWGWGYKRSMTIKYIRGGYGRKHEVVMGNTSKGLEGGG